MAKRSLLLNFQHDRIDWILMRSGLRHATIEKSGHLACPGHAADDPATLAAFQQLRESLDIPGLTCLAAIGGQGLLIRPIPVPFSDKRKVRQILPMELEATLPVAVDELAVDFQLVGQEAGPMAIAVAMPHTQVEAYVHLLREAGLEPVLVTFSGLPAAALIAAREEGEATSLLVDGDHRHVMLFVVARRQIRFIRSWRPPVAGEAADGMLKAAIDQTLEAAAHVLPDEVAPSTIYLTPRSTRFYSPEGLSTDQCPAKVFDIATAAGTQIDGAVPVDQGQGALTLGFYEPLAEKGFNLYRSTFPLKRFLQQHRPHFIRCGVLAAVFTMLFMVNIYLDISHAEKRAVFLKSQAATILREAFPATRNVVDPLQQMIVKLREVRSQDFGLSRGLQVTQIDILNAISTALPDTLDIHVSQLVSGVERVQLSGTTDTFEAVNQAKELLERTDFFGGITIVSANMDQNAGRVRFKLALDLKKGP